jgi:acyl-CoA thioesterase I
MNIGRPSLAVLGVVLAAAGLSINAGAAGASALQADPERPVILAVGESTTAGYGVDPELSYPSQLQKMLDERGYHYRVVNHGRSGSTTGDALTRLDRGVALQPKIVIIALGGNDGGGRVPVDRTRQNLAKMVSLFKRIGAEVFLCDRRLSADRESSETIFAKLAREYNAVLAPPLLTGVSGHPELLLSDGTHPTGEGYTIIVANLFKVIEPYLKRGHS